MRRRDIGGLSLALLTVAFLLTAWPGVRPAEAVVREGGIEGRPGFSFRNLVYKWDHLLVEIGQTGQGIYRIRYSAKCGRSCDGDNGYSENHPCPASYLHADCIT